MKIGVTSDTHSLEIPKQLINDFQNVDLIIHAGDFCCVADLAVFKKICEVKAVYGNMDERTLRDELPQKQIFEIKGFTFGLTHGHGAARGVLDVVKKEFDHQKCDIVIFGHSHMPFNERIGETLYFNPGSPNDKVFAPYLSYGILELSDRVEGSIIKVKD